MTTDHIGPTTGDRLDRLEAETHTRRAWAAALRFGARRLAERGRYGPGVAVDDLADMIERGELTPWRTDAPPAAPASPETAAQPATGTVGPPERQSAAEAVVERTRMLGGSFAEAVHAMQAALTQAAGSIDPQPADIPALVAMPDLTDRERADFLAAAAELDGEPAPLDLDAIEARVNAATPGPWGAVWGNRIARGVEICVPGTYRAIQDVAEIPDDRCEWESDEAVEVSAEADAAFIAHARADVPALVAEVRRLRAAHHAAMAELGSRDALAAGWKREHIETVADDLDHAGKTVPASMVRALLAERDRLAVAQSQRRTRAHDWRRQRDAARAERDTWEAKAKVRGDHCALIGQALDKATAELAQARHDLATARRDCAADALDWVAEHLIADGDRGVQMLRDHAERIRAGELTIPTTTEETDHDAH